MRRKLLDKGYDKDVVAALLDVLRTDKLLDDRRYIDNFVGYHAARGQGPLRIRQALKQKGVDGAAVEECLEAYPDWQARLQETRKKKFGAHRAENFMEKQRQARFLGYRGFTGAQIRTALGFDVDLDSDT